MQAMGDGSLSLERFSYYMRQDFLFLIDYCRVLAIASAKSPDLASMGRFAALLELAFGKADTPNKEAKDGR